MVAIAAPAASRACQESNSPTTTEISASTTEVTSTHGTRRTSWIAAAAGAVISAKTSRAPTVAKLATTAAVIPTSSSAWVSPGRSPASRAASGLNDDISNAR